MRNVKRLWHAAAASAVIALAVCLASPFSNTAARGADIDRTLPSPLLDEAPKNSGSETLILAGGCFWGVQGVFQTYAGSLMPCPATMAARPTLPNMRS